MPVPKFKPSLPDFYQLSALAFIPLLLIYDELFLHDMIREDVFTTPRFYILLLAALAIGLFLNAVIAFLPNKKTFRCITGILSGIFLFLAAFFAGMEFSIKNLFGNYFSITACLKMVPNIVSNYGSTVGSVFQTNYILYFLLAAPIIIYFFLFKHIWELLHTQRANCFWMLILGLLAQSGSVLLCLTGDRGNVYSSGFTASGAIEEFGLATEAQLELTYTITGVPEVSFSFNQAEIEEGIPYNIFGLDYAKLAETETNSSVADIHQYVSSIVPTEQNEYTGLFAGKNLIMICAESFAPPVVDPELTPTLYKLSHEGFVFNDFYQPLWGQSTTGGEFSFMTGLIPTWINESYTFNSTYGNDMYTSPGWTFRGLGYTTKAYHNGDVEFYDRQLSHPHMGYDYAAQGYSITTEGVKDPNGSLVFESSGVPLDKELFSQTLPAAIQSYLETEKPFHTYYMTISGHGQYGWGIGPASRNKDIILAKYPNISEPAGAYLADNMELEYAMAYLLDTLTKAGVADDTVICLVADHYPYFLVDNQDFYNELTGIGDSDSYISRYKNTCILWNGCMAADYVPEETMPEDVFGEKVRTIPTGPIPIDTPCTAVDILPTLYNLFGIEYDSRLFSGRDLLAPDRKPNTAYNGMPVAVIPTGAGRSWKTNAGTYEAATGTFTPKKGVTVSNGYVASVHQIVDAKYTYAQKIIAADYYRSVHNALNALKEKQAEAEKAAEKTNKNSK